MFSSFIYWEFCCVCFNTLNYYGSWRYAPAAKRMNESFISPLHCRWLLVQSKGIHESYMPTPVTDNWWSLTLITKTGYYLCKAIWSNQILLRNRCSDLFYRYEGTIMAPSQMLICYSQIHSFKSYYFVIVFKHTVQSGNNITKNKWSMSCN